MQKNNRFNLVFAKMVAMVEEERSPKSGDVEAVTHRNFEVTSEELDEIDELRRIVLDITEPVPMSFTTT